MRVQRRQQLSVYLENRVGALADLCRAIAERRINLLAICAIDTVEEAVLRIVPEDPGAARRALEERGHRVIETPVLAIELPNEPGATGAMAARLAAAGVNVDYLYASAHPAQPTSLLVLRTHQSDEAESVLEEAGGAPAGGRKS